MNTQSQIYNLIKSDDFKKALEKINVNYSNLKQENVIRNEILELYNAEYSTPDVKAFAEHPRFEKNDEGQKINGRVDLSILNKSHLEKPYKIEFKYHFTKHRKDFSNYTQSIKNEFCIRKSDMFILIVQTVNIEDKNKFDGYWGIETKLTKYQSKNDNWKENLIKCFNDITVNIENSCELLESIKIEIQKPYQTQYHFISYPKNKNQ